MTLITNLFTKDYIIVAADKRRTMINEETRQAISKDDVVKLFAGKNYCIGIQGKIVTKNCNYLEVLSSFVSNNKKISTENLVDLVLSKFDMASKDTYINELNLTISGIEETGFFSIYIDLKNKKVVNCLEVDKNNIRFNRANSMEEQLYRQSMIFLKRTYDKVSGKIKYGEQEPRLYNLEDNVRALEVMYEAFHKSVNSSNHLIGGGMDYCVITKEEVHLELTSEKK